MKYQLWIHQAKPLQPSEQDHKMLGRFETVAEAQGAAERQMPHPEDTFRIVSVESGNVMAVSLFRYGAREWFTVIDRGDANPHTAQAVRRSRRRMASAFQSARSTVERAYLHLQDLKG